MCRFFHTHTHPIHLKALYSGANLTGKSWAEESVNWKKSNNIAGDQLKLDKHVDVVPEAGRGDKTRTTISMNGALKHTAKNSRPFTE